MATVRLIAGDDDLARIFLEGLADPASLSPIEAFRFRFLLGAFTAPITQAYNEWRLGISDEREVLERFQQSRSIFSTPGYRWYWHDQRASYDSERREYFEAHFE